MRCCNLILAYFRRRPKVMFIALLLGVINGLGFGLLSESDLREAARHFKKEWSDHVLSIFIGIGLGLFYRIEKVRSFYLTPIARLLFSLVPAFGFLAFWTGLTTVLTTYVRFHHFHYSHVGIHAMQIGVVIFLACIMANIGRT